MSSASARLSIGIARRSDRSGDAHGFHLLRLNDSAHQRLPSAIEGTLRGFIGDVPCNDAIVIGALALDAPRQLEPFRSLNAQPRAAAVEHLDIIGSASPRGSIEGLMGAQ